MRKKRPQTSIFIYGWRLGLVAAGLVCLFCAIYARLYYLHVERSERSLEATYKARQLLDKVPARRGNIVDAKDNLLATSRPVITLGADPERVELNADGIEKLGKVAQILKLRKADVVSVCTPYQDAEKISAVNATITEAQAKRIRMIGVNLNMTPEELVRKCVTTPNNTIIVQRRAEQVAAKKKVFRELAKIFKMPQEEV